MDLYSFQKDGVAYLQQHKQAALFDQMGLGKTAQALCAIQTLSAIVVCPKVARGVWVDECERWRPDLKPVLIKGRKGFRLPEDGELVLLNYELLPSDSPPLRSHVTLIGDEAHYVKSPDSQRGRCFRKLSRQVLESGGNVWVLTGTPLLNEPPDLWYVLKAAQLADKAFSSWDEFYKLFGGKEVSFSANGRYGQYQRTFTKWATRPDASVSKRLRRVALWRKREQVLPQLPTKTYRRVYVDMPKKIRDLADDVLRVLSARDQSPKRALELILSNRAREQLTFEKISQLRSMMSVVKIKALQQMLDDLDETNSGEETRPAVVFSAYRATIDTLAVRKGWRIIHGDVPQEERERIVKEFQSGNLLGLGATIATAGTALTLTRSYQMFFSDLDWTPARNAQAEDRVCRIGQDRGVIVTHLIGRHPLEEMVLQSLTRKSSIEQSALA